MTRSKGFISKVFTPHRMRALSLLLLLNLLTEIFYPTCAWALTGGPSQPEVQSFEPIGTSDMVDLFSGDFTYNIPLLDVDGYPVNISYHSGISMDDEASWVGLGWNINAGVINRNLRGIPDDFKGDEIKKELNTKPNRTFGLRGGFSTELFGKEFLTLNASLGINYNNYRGMGTELSASISLNSASSGKGPLTGSLGLTSSSENGLTIAPSVNFSVKLNKDQKRDGDSYALGFNVGTAINTRSGMKQLSISSSISQSHEKATKYTLKNGNQASQSGSLNFGGVSSTFSFGSATYIPTGGPNMNNLSVTGKFRFGLAAYGVHGAADISGYYSQQKLATTTTVNKAYGYMHHDAGITNNTALFDFNRENDGSFSENTPAMALAQYTFDTYGVSGQGVGGSYRAVRSDMGYIYDASSMTTSDGFDIGLELGLGGISHNGGDFTVMQNNTTSGMWNDQNLAKNYLRPKSTNGSATYEKYYFKEANEKTIEGDEFYNNVGGSKAARVELLDNGDFNVVANNRLQLAGGGFINLPASNTRSKREKRNQVFYPLLNEEVDNGAGLEYLPAGSYAQASAPNHHIAEITTYATDGSRYVYGIPAYNTTQKEITFAVGSTPNNNNGLTGDCASGLVAYGGSDNSLGNERGLDNYYSATTTPAYAHSYLLTAVLSPDYIDSDQTKGPSNDDMGYYTKFSYDRIDGYKWRTPYSAANQANYNEGIKTDVNDDKASIIYGEKELWYLNKIETKNYIAIFHTIDRHDGVEAGGENGGSGSQSMKKLDRISLYSRHDFYTTFGTPNPNAVPIKEVHFVYSYELCKGVPNNPTAGEGKLTLREIYFTYQDSQKAKFSSYKFEYNSLNPDYAYKAYDRWGNYKAMPASPGCGNSGNLVPAEYPYVEQDKTLADQYTSAWHLTDIKLPSGGRIKVNYESDDYAHVQHKSASQMFRIAGYDNSFPSTENEAVDITAPGKKIYFPLQGGVTDIDKYIGGMDRIYFRFLMETNNTTYDYVSGYFKLSTDPNSKGVDNIGGTNYGFVIPESVDINDAAASDNVNPIVKAAIQYCRLNIPRLIYNQPAISDNDSFGEQLLNSLISIGSNFTQAVMGENKWILEKGKCETAVLKKSWIRLYNPIGKKLGGGCRVQSVQLFDQWKVMTNYEMSEASYGQEYFYDTNGDGTGASSGVATYEPQVGGDENVWKQPIFTHEKNLLAPDGEHYMEEPFGESMFPGASVGYAKVTVKNQSSGSIKKHATGKVVHEFYTAKDFPVIVERTGVLPIQDKTDPFSITSIFYVRSKDYMTASQGFSIETNDMHGKPKKQSVYQEDKADPISSVEYRYKSQPYLTGCFRLDNKVQVIEPNGNVSLRNIGLVFDMVTDFRQQKTEMSSVATMANLDGFIWPFPTIPVAVPIVLPSLTEETTQFRSVATTKLTHRFGIQEEVIAKDLGSAVSTKNLAYDSETGDVLLTQTTTDFNDAIYSMTYPAHWYYDGMGQAYRNIGLERASVTLTAGNATLANADKHFAPGDVLLMKNGSSWYTGWVVNVSGNSVSIVDAAGNGLSGAYLVKIIRSGRRNLQSVPIATLTTLSNPLPHFSANVYDKVLQASAVEFSDRWRTFCDCFDNSNSPMIATKNPYLSGSRGNWRSKTSFLHLSPRSQSYNNNNTNLRKDGVFTSYTPYYRLNSGKWQVDEKNWTYTSEVTEYSPYGQELENRDALGRFSSATFGYKQAFAKSVAANAQYRDIGFDNFEDHNFSQCADNHFKFEAGNLRSAAEAHSGRYSVRIQGGNTLTMSKSLELCSPEGCTLSANASNTSSVTTKIDITGGQQPYQVDWNVIDGNPAIKFDGVNFNSLIATGNNYTVEIIVLDSQGCKITQTVSH